MTRRKGIAAAVAAGVGAALLWAVTAWACTPLPSVSLSQAFGSAGSQIQVTGTSWSPTYGPVIVHWDALNGPILAQTQPDGRFVLPPVTVTVPQNALPGYHMIVVSAPEYPASATRAIFQVMGSGVAAAQPPQVLLPATSEPTSQVSMVAVGVVATMGVLGLLLFGAGTTAVVRSYRRTPVAGSVRTR